MKDKECKEYMHTYKCECESCEGCEYRYPEKLIRRIDDLGRIVIPKELRKEVLGTSDMDELAGKPFSIEKVYSSDYKKWGFIIIPIEEEN